MAIKILKGQFKKKQGQHLQVAFETYTITWLYNHIIEITYIEVYWLKMIKNELKWFRITKLT